MFQFWSLWKHLVDQKGKFGRKGLARYFKIHRKKIRFSFFLSSKYSSGIWTLMGWFKYSFFFSFFIRRNCNVISKRIPHWKAYSKLKDTRKTSVMALRGLKLWTSFLFIVYNVFFGDYKRLPYLEVITF